MGRRRGQGIKGNKGIAEEGRRRGGPAVDQRIGRRDWEGLSLSVDCK